MAGVNGRGSDLRTVSRSERSFDQKLADTRATALWLHIGGNLSPLHRFGSAARHPGRKRRGFPHNPLYARAGLQYSTAMKTGPLSPAALRRRRRA
jgi:hypothetical protein